MRKKAEREEAREAELNAIRVAKEREITRLRATQEKAQDQQALLDELNALQAQEEVAKNCKIYHCITAVITFKFVLTKNRTYITLFRV